MSKARISCPLHKNIDVEQRRTQQGVSDIRFVNMADSTEDFLAAAVWSSIPDMAQRLAVVKRLTSKLEEASDPANLPIARAAVGFLVSIEADTRIDGSGRYDNDIRDITYDVASFLSRVVRGSQDRVVLEHVAQICEQQSWCTNSILSRCRKPVQAASRILVDHTNSDVYRGHEESDEDEPAAITASLCCLRFLQVYYGLPRRYVPHQVDAQFKEVLGLVECQDDQTSSYATCAAVSMISRMQDEVRQNYRHHNCQRVWNTVVSLLSSEPRSTHINSGLTLWLRILPRLQTEEMLQNSEYWDMLRFQLSQGTKEQQKLSLTILRLSIRLYYHEHPEKDSRRKEAFQHFTTFALIYESTVLVGYLNQLIESLPDLSSLSQAGSTVHACWVVALLNAALGTSAQYSIRKTIGEWVMRSPPHIIADAGSDGAAFLQETFLYWASLGSFFTSTMRQHDDRKIVCIHGNTLHNYIVKLLSVETSEARSRHLNAMLCYIKNQGDRLFAYARAYLLEGIVDVVSTSAFDISPNQAEMVLDIAFTAGFPEIVSDYMTMVSSPILSRCSIESKLSGHVPLLFFRWGFADQNAAGVWHNFGQENRLFARVRPCILLTMAVILFSVEPVPITAQRLKHSVLDS